MCQILSPSDNQSTRYLLPNFVDFVESVTDKNSKRCVSAYHVATIIKCVADISVRSIYTKMQTRHIASTSKYSLTFRVRVTTPPQYGRNGTAHAAGASMFSPARGVFAGLRNVRVRHACGVRWAWRSVAIATQPVHRLQIRPIVQNYGASPTTPPSYIRIRAIVWACGRG